MEIVPKDCFDGNWKVAMTSQDDILAIPDVASLLKVAEKTVYGLCTEGRPARF